MFVQIPVTTEVIEKNADLQPKGKFEENRLLIELDLRQRDYHQLFQLKRNVPINWYNERTFEVQELSAFAWPLVYRVTTADAYYLKAPGQRVNFTPHIQGLCTKRKVSDVALRLGVFLCIIAGLGTRKASWLMSVLFQLAVSKSALERWVEEVADNLPSEDEMVKLLQQQKPITQGHFDELFPRGTDACVLVLKDEHGRLLAAEEVAKRDAEHVKPLLARFARLGLKFTSFYIDHCQAYFNAIGAVYPQAEIQYDYFHILPNIWRKVWGEFRCHRRDLKARSEAVATRVVRAEIEKDGGAFMGKSLLVFHRRRKPFGARERKDTSGTHPTTGNVLPARLPASGLGDLCRPDDGSASAGETR